MDQIPPKNPKNTRVHHVLAHSYVVYLILFLVAVYLDYIYRISVFHNSLVVPLGIICLLISSIIIIWAQKTGSDLRKVEEVRAEHFKKGPYIYTRIPTQWGLFLLMLGFGMISNAVFVILATFISFLISRFWFIAKHDQILLEKYGDAYSEYKNSVKF